MVVGMPLVLSLFGKISFSYISLTKWLDWVFASPFICPGVEEPFLRNSGSITYHDNFALLLPLIVLLLGEASGNS